MTLLEVVQHGVLHSETVSSYLEDCRLTKDADSQEAQIEPFLDNCDM